MAQHSLQPKHIAQEILEQSFPREEAAAIFDEKIRHKQLRLRATSPDPASQDARARRRSLRLRKFEGQKRRTKVKPLSAKEKRMSGIYDVPKDARKFEFYLTLHNLWVGYMREILDLSEGQMSHITAQSKGSILAGADFHGALVTVVRSRCTSHVGLEGIVVRDTKFTFQIITRKNELKIIPKAYTVFRYEVPRTDAKEATSDSIQSTSPLVFEVHGSQIEVRPADRATRKFKQKYLKYI